MTRPSLAKLRKLEATNARREGAGRPRVITPETGEALREELMFGRLGPAFGSGPAKTRLVGLMIANMSHGATPDPTYAGRFHALAAEGRAHYEAANGQTPTTSVKEVRARVAAFYGPKLRAAEAEAP